MKIIGIPADQIEKSPEWKFDIVAGNDSGCAVKVELHNSGTAQIIEVEWILAYFLMAFWRQGTERLQNPGKEAAIIVPADFDFQRFNFVKTAAMKLNRMNVVEIRQKPF